MVVLIVALLKDTVMQIGKVLINDRLHVSTISGKFHIPTIYNSVVLLRGCVGCDHTVLKKKLALFKAT